MEHSSLDRPSTTLTMSSTAPSPSSTGATTAPAATSTQPFLESGGIPHIFVVFICASVLVLTSVSLCVWRRLNARGAFQSDSVYIPIARGRKNDDDPAKGRPEMFDAWTGRCTSNSMEWDGHIPFSVTVLANADDKRASVPVRKVGKLPGDCAREKREGEKQDQGSHRLQVGVLVAMPSLPHTKTHDGVGQELSGSPLRDGLAIGLIEMPWIEEDRRLLKKIAS